MHTIDRSFYPSDVSALAAPATARPEDRRVVTPAVGLAVATFAAYMVGAGRAFGYDGAVTMELFVSGPPAWALERQAVFNNHPLFSLLESLIFDVTGGGEVPMRVAPALFAAVAVGLLAWRLAERWSRRAGVAAGVFMAAAPIVAELSRDVRGYSLALLAIVVMGIAVLDVRSPRLFGVAAVVGIGTHLYAVIPFAALVAWVVTSGRFGRWRPAVLGGLAGGLSVYVAMADDMGGGRMRVFRPTWPVDAAWELLGGGVVAVAATAVLLVVACRRAEITVELRAAAAVVVLGVVGPWLIAPPDLYPRFVFWLVPAVAVAVAWAVDRDPRFVPVAALAVVAALAPQVSTWADDDRPNRELGRRVSGDVCYPTWPAEAVLWYADGGRFGWRCERAAILEPASPEATAWAEARVLRQWPDVCWSTPGAELRARPGGCEAGDDRSDA